MTDERCSMYRSQKTRDIHQGIRVHYTTQEEMSLQEVLGILSQTTPDAVEPRHVLLSRGAHLTWDDDPTEEELGRDRAWKAKSAAREAALLKRLEVAARRYEDENDRALIDIDSYHAGMARVMLTELRRPDRHDG